jgi:hypothetical protein
MWSGSGQKGATGVSLRAVFRLYSILMVIVFLAASVGMVAHEASAQPADSDTGTTVYLQHIGDSGKPILPLVISSAPPPEGESERVLGDVEALEASFVTLSGLDLGKIVGSTKMLIETAGEEPASLPFGTFRVTVVDPEEESSAVLPREQLAPLLDLLEETAGTKYEALAGWVSAVKHRLSLAVGS